MKKRIGISLTTVNPAFYWSWFSTAELEHFELVDLSFKNNNLYDFQKCDAFILTGGDDVHPSLYNGVLEYDHKPAAFHLERDVFEEKLYRHAIENNKPLLGICRGLQIVNVIEGGKLLQDLGAENNTLHKANGGDKEHIVTVIPDTLLQQVTGQISGTVNSAHHQAIDPGAIGKNIKVNCWSTDGIIEGIEFDNKTNLPWMLCVQWHPERMKDQQNLFTKNIKSSFLSAI